MEDIDKLAQAFMDGFTDGNGQWDDNFPEYHREKYRQGVVSLLAELHKPKDRFAVFKDRNVTYWPDGTASQTDPFQKHILAKPTTTK